METVFSMLFVRNVVIPEEIAGKQFCMEIGEGATWVREAEESPLLEAGEDTAGAVICGD
jgi:hypothetical protein